MYISFDIANRYSALEMKSWNFFEFGQPITVDPGYDQRQGNAIGVSYNRTFLYPGFKRNEIASRGQGMH